MTSLISLSLGAPLFGAAASQGTSFSFITLLAVTIGASVPLVLASLGGLYSERSGIINIGLEGMMLVGAFAAGWVGVTFPESTLWGPWFSLLLGGVVGGALALVHVLLCVVIRGDQIISGVAINILAIQGTSFLSILIFGGKGGSGLVKTMPKLSLGPLQLSPFFFFALVTLFGSWWLLFRTPFGLRLRGCGEYPVAIQSAGISVKKMQASAVIISGVLAGMGGAILVHEAGNFGKEMTAGRGYIALAALIFGAWKPFRTFFACLLFGFAYALNFQLQVIPGLHIPPEWLNMLPYLLTILALCGFVGRARPPAFLGKIDARERA